MSDREQFAKALVQEFKVVLTDVVNIANLRESNHIGEGIPVKEIDLALVFRRNTSNPEQLLLFLNYNYGPINGSVLLS